MKIGAAYIRVSTDEQLEYSPDSQLKIIKEYAAKHDITILPEFIYVDEGISGRNVKKRNAFNDMIGTAKTKPKPFDVVLLWKFSRFARNQEEALLYKNMLRKKLGIDVVSVSEPLIDGPFGDLIERIIEWSDEYYSINLSQEVKRGMREKALRGEHQTIAPYGYSKKSGEMAVINDVEAAFVKKVFQMYLDGSSTFAIAGALNAMGARTRRGNFFENRQIEYMLNNPFYAGYVRWSPEKTASKRIYDSVDTITVKSTHQAIINEEIWRMTQEKYQNEKLKRKKHVRPAESRKHWLSGILKCGGCGAAMTYSTANNGFQCIRYAHGTCKPSHFINADKIATAVIEGLEFLSTPGVFIQHVQRTSSPISEENKLRELQLSSLEKMLERAKNAYLSGFDTLEEYSVNKSKILREIDDIRSKIKPEPEVDKIDQDQLKAKIRDILSLLKSDAAAPEKNAALAQTVEKITFSRPEEYITIYFYG